MRLELHRNDLMDDFKDVHYRETEFHMFKDDVKKAMLIVGEAIYNHHKSSGYSNILVPKKFRGS